MITIDILAQFEAFYAWAITTLIPSMAFAYALSYLGGLLFGQDLKGTEDEPKGQSFAWNPHTTRQEGIPKPICWGRNKHFGNEIMSWTDVDPISGNEVLYKALDYGRGPVQGVSGGIVSDVNHCLGGTPAFTILLDNYIDTWWQTAGNVNDDNRTTYVGFDGREGDGKDLIGRFQSEVTFAGATTIDRIEYRRSWYIKGDVQHTGYEKVYLYYEDAYHLIATRNITTEGTNVDTIMIESGGPWPGVTKIKIEIELSAKQFWFACFRDKSYVTYRLYELRAWRLEDVPVYLNGQPAHNYPEVIVRGRQGTLNQTCMEGFEKNKLEYPHETTIVYGEPVRWTSPDKFFDDIEFTLAWLGGLFYYSNDGKVKTHGVGIKVEISVRDTEEWSDVLVTTVSAKQLHAFYKAYSVNTLVPDTVEHGTQYDLRFSKTSDDKAPTRYGDEVQLRSVRGVVDVAFTHPGRAMLGIIAQATERLQGDIDVTWVTDDKLVNVFDGESWSIAFTRNRAFIYLDGVTQPIISGDGDENPWTIERFEGLDPSRVNLAFIWKWAQWCDGLVPSGIGEETEKRMPCDIICDQQTNVWSITYEIAQIGRMYPYWRGVMLTGWIDKATDEDIDLITMDNTMARSWKSSYAGYGEMAGSVKTFYKNSAQDYERKPRPVFNKNSGTYTRVIALEGVGVTSESFATRVGNHALKRNELIKNINGCRMPREALRYNLGRVVRIQCNVPGWGQAFRVVTSPTNYTCELDRIIEDVAPGDLLWVKTYDTVNKKISLDSYTVSGTTGKVVTIEETWAAGCTPLKNHLAAIGIDGAIVLRRIVKMKHIQENYFDVELETYDTTLFASDDADPELTNPTHIHQPVTQLAIPITRQTVVDLIEALAVPALKIAKPRLFNCAWEGDEESTVEWSKRNPDEPILVEWEGTTYEITPDSTTLQFIYWDSETPTVFSKTANPAVALAPGIYLTCVNNAGFAQPADMTQTQHGAIIQIGTLIAEQIIISGINALELMNAPAEAGADITIDHVGNSSDNLIWNSDFEIGDLSEWTRNYGSGTPSLVSGVAAPYGGQVFQTVGYAGFTHNNFIAVDTAENYYGEVWVNQTVTGTDPTFYCGVSCYDEDKSWIGDHYFLATAVELASGNGWVKYTGYITGEHATAHTKFETGTKYIKPFFLVNHSTGDGTTQFAFIRFTKARQDLADLDEKSVDSLTDGSIYARMLKAWRHTSDPTKLDLSLGFAASITTAQIGLLAVHTAQIDDLAVDSLQIKDHAVTLPVFEFTAAEIDFGAAEVVLQEIEFVCSGQPLAITFVAPAKKLTGGDAAYKFYLRLYRDTTKVYESELAMPVLSYMPLATFLTEDNPGAGTYTYQVRIIRSHILTGRVKDRALRIIEFKK